MRMVNTVFVGALSNKIRTGEEVRMKTIESNLDVIERSIRKIEREILMMRKRLVAPNRKNEVTNKNWKVVMDVIDRADEGLFPKDIIQATGYKDTTVRSYLKRMSANGLISAVNGRYYIIA